ncbi:MAG TPA: hypothetical protein PKL73_14705 [Polyangiaceae bacterium]|nr:hypothetical protein [Polyangiaceae bacterium]HNZ24577.1 hypothetical protein [Polyangiaceae bacterium]HOD25707.1 hypothetical protein [Polyangiaceae bacterium]HOE51758.1 hypothetical protein [Polyangiaceae bacterium]HOH01056.1 hypothetical protein [Polyangiaceae bacterium]
MKQISSLLWSLGFIAIGLSLGAVACGDDEDDNRPSGSGGATGGAGGATGGSAGETGGVGGATGGSAGATGGSAGETAGAGGATGGSGGGGSQAEFVIGVDGIAAFDAMSSADKDALKGTKVFFQHMSVGENLLMGYNNWSPPWKGGTASLGFVFSSVNDASSYGSVELGDKAFGYNGNPFNKIKGFREHVLDMGIGSAVQVAGFKFCYNDLTVDITSTGTDVIDAYRSAYQDIEKATSGTSFFHVTTPLQPADQWQTVENNTLRRSFAEFLRSTYAGGRHVVFDLQQIESTDTNGSTCSQSGVPVLCEAWAADSDGHLNDAGATRAAKAFLYALHVARGL